MKTSRFRSLLIVALIGLQVVTLLGVYLATRKNTETILRAHAEEVMGYLVRNVQDAAEGVLAPAEQAARLVRLQAAKGQLDTHDDKALEALFQSELQAQPGLSGMFLGRDDGSFLFVNRMAGGYRTKRITTGSERRVELIFYDLSLRETERQVDLEDAYDPRQRPWYRAATAAGDLIWTDPYLFFSVQRPGLTAAVPVAGSDGGAAGVVGVDLEITGLSRYIDIPVGRQGWTLIGSAQGLAVAYPGIAASLSSLGGDALPTVQEIGGDVLTALEAAAPGVLSAPEQQTFTEFIVADEPHYAVVSPFEVAGLPWVMVVQAPAADFIGPIKNHFRSGTYQILGVGLLTLLLAVPVGFRMSRPLNRLVQRSTSDGLTGLLSRSAFREQAGRCLREQRRRGASCALAVLDLDYFKPVNDVYGHAVGDEVLRAVGQRLSERLRAGDLVGRLGGDEFMVFLADISPNQAFETTERLRAYVGGAPILSSADQHLVGATAGVAVDTGEALSDLLVQADAALIAGKARQKGQTYIAGPSTLSYEQLRETTPKALFKTATGVTLGHPPPG